MSVVASVLCKNIHDMGSLMLDTTLKITSNMRVMKSQTKRQLFEKLSTWLPLIGLEETLPFRESSLPLKNNGIDYVGDIVARTRDELLSIDGLAPSTVD